MDTKVKAEQENQHLVSRLFARLKADAPAYEWDTSFPPFHSSYDNWHVWGRKRATVPPSPTIQDGFKKGRRFSEENQEGVSQEPEEGIRIVARISRHSLRLEREYKLARKLASGAGRDQHFFINAVDFLKLPSRQQGEPTLVVMISESPGRNYLIDMASSTNNSMEDQPKSPSTNTAQVELGPNFYPAVAAPSDESDALSTAMSRQRSQGPFSLKDFLNFAIGAATCCEQLHHGNEIVHGELRGDAFHYNRETGVVRLINFGSGARSFENGLTSAGWSSLTSQLGVEHKLQFIAPEQTGRMPAEPDCRTDIYSLGILFWTILADEPAFDGNTPLDIMQNVLSRRIPPIDSKRPDVPPILSRIIQKMTQKSMPDRYQSSSGLTFDLITCRRMLEDGDSTALAAFKLGSKDVSSSFNHPNWLIGRDAQLGAVTQVIEKAAARVAQRPPVTKHGLENLRSHSTLSSERPDASLLDDVISETSSSERDKDGRLRSLPEATTLELTKDRMSVDNAGGSPLDSRISHGSRASTASVDAARASSLDTPRSFSIDYAVSRSASQSFAMPNGSLRRAAQRLKKAGPCEVVAISGAAGLGKSALLQTVQGRAREHGYYASSKFDRVKKAPFEPVFRAMSSLFRQIFSEGDVNTEFHQNVRALVRPVWGSLHTALELPSWLLSPNLQHAESQNSAENGPASCHAKCGEKGNTAADWLHAGGVIRDRRFISTFVEVLRLLAIQKFLCLCLDDLQFADDESLELIRSVVVAGIPIVLILTFRSEAALPIKSKGLLDHVTKVELTPFSDEQVAEYLAATLHRSSDYVLPLVAVVQQKTAGSPFFIREMLDECYRKKCLYYSWKSSSWELDFDKVYTEFPSQDGQQVSAGDYIHKRLQDLPSGAPTLLSWASLVGTSFTFTLLNRVITCDCSKASPMELLPPRADDAVAALQAAIASYAIMPTEEEDTFRFSHDRYMSAAYSLCEPYPKEEMSFVISSAMLKHDPWTDEKPTQILFDQSRHICNAITVIQQRAASRKPFRQLLYRAAEIAREQSARQLSLSFLQYSLELLADDPWDDGDKQAETTYDEILTLMTQTAGSLWYLGEFEGAYSLTQAILKHAKNAADRSAAFVIESRIHAQKGDSRAALTSMKRALADLGITLQPMTWQECDTEFERIVPLIKAKEPDLDDTSISQLDAELVTTGAVMIELLSAAFWSDQLLFYQLTLQNLRLYLEQGLFPQVALGYVHLASVAVARFDMLEFGIEMGNTAKKIMAKFHDEAYTNGRGLTLHALFLGHLESSMMEQLPVLREGLEATITAGDKILFTLNIGVTAAFRLWVNQEFAEVEAFIADQYENLPDWEVDVRGGAILTSVRQYARAMQGKTMFRIGPNVLDDEFHRSAEYCDFLSRTSSEPTRPLAIYGSYKLTALYRFGHVKEALEFGEQLMGPVSTLWCMRYNYVSMFYYALAVVDKVRTEPDAPDRESYLNQLRDLVKKIKTVNNFNDSNFASWLHLLEAEMAEIDHHFDSAIKAYEAAVTHTVLHCNHMEEALAYELYAEFLIRRGSSRPARGMILDAIAAYQTVGALGKVEHINEKHAFTLHGTRSLATMDAQTQTVEEVDQEYNYYQQYRLSKTDADMNSQTSEERTKAWLAPTQSNANREYSSNPPGLSAVGLDMIDLANILESSQLLSSELQVDKLLANLTKIIVESTGADFGGVVVNDDDIGWMVAALHGPEGPIDRDVGVPLDKVADSMARQITLYALRFRESVSIQNVLDDERFAVTAQYRKENPDGRAVIGLPILHGDNTILGAIYIEGPPRSFTERNTAVLRLLVNQISISIANALLFKKLEKASANNASMLELQRSALEQAREAESKAKIAEAHAMEQVRLKEEAAKAKSMFLANISHEIRTPLNGVIGMSELLKASSLNDEQGGYVDSIRVCADTLLSVINDVLDFSKLEAGKMQMFNVQLSLNETISEVVRALSYTNIERGLQTIEQLQLDPKMLVMGDPLRLHQVFMNLLSNAYKFTAKGRVTVRAVLEEESDSSITVCCSVTDTGIGVSEEQRKKLFLPFSQADGSTARTYGGTGLGLSICKAIVEIMKGRIWLTSEPGVGTTVSFTLPFQKVVHSQGQPIQAKGSRAADPMSIWSSTAQDGAADAGYNSLAGISRDQLKICIAEDNPINQKIAISFVQKLGFKCKAFGDGQQAVDALTEASAKGDPFHLVLMDVQMPVLDGYNATREIRSHKDPKVNGVLVIAMTASAIRGDREKCLDAGMNNYLAKPVRAHVLKQMLEGYLNQATKDIPQLQEQAQAMAQDVLDRANDDRKETPKGLSTRSAEVKELVNNLEATQLKDAQTQ